MSTNILYSMIMFAVGWLLYDLICIFAWKNSLKLKMKSSILALVFAECFYI